MIEPAAKRESAEGTLVWCLFCPLREYERERFPARFDWRGTRLDKKQLLVQELEKRAADKRISCAAARQLAEEMGMPARAVGQLCDALGIKITACDLGCFQ
jgi:hypothetical protein